jgi:hypothetical protein
MISDLICFLPSIKQNLGFGENLPNLELSIVQI